MEKLVLMIATVPSMIGQFNMNNIHMLLDMGYKVDVAADFKDTSVWATDRVLQFKRDLEAIDVECYQIDFSRNPLYINRHIKSYREMIKLLAQRQYSFIHTHTPIASAIVRVAAHKTKTKVIYTAHGFHFYDGAPVKNWILFYPVEKFLSKWTDVLITINKEDFKRAVYNFNAKKTIYIPGVGVDTEKFADCFVDVKKKREEIGVKSDDFLLLSVGELASHKNQKIVIDAIEKMKHEENINNIIYLVVGKGILQKKYEHLIKKYGIEKHVKLLGYRSDICELCKMVDCFVHPSLREGLGIAPLEAMAAGLPLITAYTGGIRDYTENDVSGCCINPNSIVDMIQALKRMYADVEFRKRCGENNRKTAKIFDIRNTNKIMHSVYSNI